MYFTNIVQQPSTNMDDSGFFSVQVISRALAVWSLDLLPLNSSNPVATRAKNSPISANAYICNFRWIFHLAGTMFGTKELNKLTTRRVKCDRDCSHENADQPPPPGPILASSHSRGKQTNSPN